jgi:hypothetical protein
LSKLAGRKRRIFLIGGSNTVKVEGWAKRFSDRVPEEFQVVNLSCGAATTLMGLYRFLAHPEPARPGDIVLWEYAINEDRHAAGQVGSPAQPIPVLMHHVRWLIKLCQDQEIHFLPIVMTIRDQFVENVVSRYEQRLCEMLVSSRIEFLSCRAITQKLLQQGHKIRSVYSDRLHYSVKGPMPDIITDEILKLLPSLCQLSSANLPWLADYADQHLTIVTDFKGDPPSRYENSFFQGTAYSLQNRLTAQITGTVMGCIIFATEARRGFTVSNGTTQIGPFSTQCELETLKKKWLLKQISIQAGYPHLPFVVSGEISIERALSLQKIMVQKTFIWNQNKTSVAEDAIVAVIIESGSDRIFSEAPTPRRKSAIKILRNRFRRSIKSLLRKLRR